MNTLDLSNIKEISHDIKYDKNTKILQPSYGKYLENFTVGSVFAHPRGITLSSGFLHDFHTTFLESNPLYLNEQYAQVLGYSSIPASPLLVMNIILSLGVQNNSEKAYANLGYYNVHFLEPVYAGDTLYSFTKIIDKQVKDDTKPGIVTLFTVGFNQNQKKVISYQRKIMVPHAPKNHSSKNNINNISSDCNMNINENEELKAQLPSFDIQKVPTHFTGSNTRFDNFSVGDTIITFSGRTISEEHYAWTYKLGNTHPLHFDKVYSGSLSGSMSGSPVVYGGLVFAWLLGLASRDISENSIWDLGYTEGYHTQPAFAGDTIHVIHRVLSKDDTTYSHIKDAGIVQFQTIGTKNVKPIDILEKHGSDLFIKEKNKKKLGKEKIPEKIFEIERKLLILK